MEFSTSRTARFALGLILLLSLLFIPAMVDAMCLEFGCQNSYVPLLLDAVIAIMGIVFMGSAFIGGKNG